MGKFTDNTRIIEIIVIAAFVIFGVYTNAKEVPMIKSTLEATVTKVAVLEQRFNDVKTQLDRIEDAVTRR